MKKERFIGNKKIQVGDKEYSLVYYLIEDIRAAEEGCALFGIRIDKCLEDDNIETQRVEAISYSRSFVLHTLDLLMRNKVTPISMVEIIDDIVTEKVCS